MASINQVFVMKMLYSHTIFVHNYFSCTQVKKICRNKKFRFLYHRFLAMSIFCSDLQNNPCAEVFE